MMPVTLPAARSTRIASLDIVRGAVMVLMAIDHVRVYSGLPAGGPTAGIFFTRWVTHFCAPAFVFLAGTSAFLYGRKPGLTRGALAQYLVTRGAFLVLLELTVIRASWTFNFDYANFTLAGVIWMLGWCMILLAGLVWLPTRVIGVFGLAVIFLQQLVGMAPRLLPAVPRAAGWIWEFVYPAGLEGPPGISILYVLVPWIGVMAAGYAFGAIVVRDAPARRRLCLRIGLTATLLFVVAAGLFVFLGPATASPMPALFRALNPPKYPASQTFLLMTLGPTIALMPLVEGARGRIATVLTTFGRVPLFYYLVHIPLIHVTALAVWWLRDGHVGAARFATAPYVSIPPAERWGLPLLYLVFAVDVAVLYVVCRWYARVKAGRPDSWLRYL